MSNIKLYIINYTIPQYNKIGIASVTASSAKQAQNILQASGKYNAYKYEMSYPVEVHTTDTFTAEALISELDNPAGEKGDRGPRGFVGPQGPKGDTGLPGKDGQDGKDGYTPQIGVMKDTDGIYYWTLDGEWLLDAKGNKIKAVGTDGADGKDGAPGEKGDPGEELTITIKPNGNIVISNLSGQSEEFMPATPSGDPMHYAYEASGCVYNSSTGLWSYREEEGGLTDLTNEDMKVCYEERWGTTNVANGVFSNIKGRTVLNNMIWSSTTDFYNSVNGCPNLEVFFIKGLNDRETYPRGLSSSFYNCPKLHTIGSPLYRKDINLEYMTTSSTGCFKLLPALENIYLRNVKVNLTFPNSSLLSKESLLYMINNCASNATFTITLHPDVYAKCQESGEWHSEVNKALSTAQSGKTTTITLASA